MKSMNIEIDDNTLKIARIAGFLYLLIIVLGISSEVLIRGHLIVPGDALLTIGNILASDALFKAGFVADSIMLLSDVAIAILFYVLLKSVNNTLALTAAAFRLIQAAIIAVSLLNYYAVQLLLHGDGISLDNNHLQSQVMLLLDMHSYGYDLGLIFFALSNFILGYLFIKSSFFPSILGVGLQMSAVVYLVGSYTRFLAPEYLSHIQPIYIIPILAELSLCLWLMFKGIRVQSVSQKTQNFGKRI